jgi:hypothetical protein
MKLRRFIQDRQEITFRLTNHIIQFLVPYQMFSMETMQGRTRLGIWKQWVGVYEQQIATLAVA